MAQEGSAELPPANASETLAQRFEPAAHSVLEYLYRDAGNYKAFGEVLLTGAWSPDRASRIEELLGGERWFVAAQVGVPPLHHQLWAFSGGPTDDDHAFHELVRIRPAVEEDRALELWGQLYELEARLTEAARAPRTQLSPNWISG